MLIVMTYGHKDIAGFPSFITPEEAKAEYPNFRIEGDRWFLDNDVKSGWTKKKDAKPYWEVGKDYRDAWYRHGGGFIIGVYDTENLEHLHYMAVAIMHATRQR
jgi:hypothetical protein